jgi:hypothetical protein
MKLKWGKNQNRLSAKRAQPEVTDIQLVQVSINRCRDSGDS